MKKINPKFNRYIYLGVTLLAVFTGGMLIHYVFSALFGNLSSFRSFFSALNSALMPVYIGIIIAYLLSPVVNKMDQYLFIPLMERIIRKKKEKVPAIARGLSIFCSLLLAIVLLVALFWMVIPEVVNSISSLAQNMPQYYNNLEEWGTGLFKKNPHYAQVFTDVSKTVFQGAMSWVQNDLLPTSNKLLSVVTDGVVNAVSYIVNCFIGLIVSIYLLAGKENFCAQIKKILYAVLPDCAVKGTLSVLRETHGVFAKFISGKIIDSLLVGILTFIIMSIAGVPYTLLISVVIGVTNIIPFFGQYIGIIPSAILVFIASPTKGILFLILIIILMQVDGNIIGPKILGDSIGLGSFWILFSILVFGSLFGIIGMICAVPVFAIVYRLVKRWCEKRLIQKGKNPKTENYRKEIVRKKKKEEKKEEK